MSMLMRKAAPVFSFVIATALLASCATSPPKPTGPVELGGTRWKLVTLGGKLDQRVIAFTKKGANGYEGTLEEPGLVLRNVTGLEIGRKIFALIKKGDNEFTGVYYAISSDGTVTEREVRLFVNGDEISWDQETAVWQKL